MNKNIKLLVKNKIIKCPTCGKQSSKTSSPFCSSRCANIDLGKWFNGTYSIPTVEDSDGSEIVRLHDDDKI
jgi:endogenous inhibitor of DNA gyrase (YacG/DUF329 family)